MTKKNLTWHLPILEIPNICFTDTKIDVKKIVTITVIIGIVSISFCTYILRRWMTKHKGNILTKINTMDFEMVLRIRDYSQL